MATMVHDVISFTWFVRCTRADLTRIIEAMNYHRRALGGAVSPQVSK